MSEEPKKIKLEDILPKYTLDDVVESDGLKKAIEEAEAEIDKHFDRLQEHIGRELVEIERQAILNIVEKNSTKDEEGNIVLFFSFIQAWKIYEIQRAER